MKRYLISKHPGFSEISRSVAISQNSSKPGALCSGYQAGLQ